MKKKIYVVSSTHWDREWYQPFQEFRARLVRMMDGLLENLKNPDYKFFHLDGQTIMIEDYLKIRPYKRAEIQKYLSEGRLLMGPWYTMPDEFLISGEGLVRNLERGRRDSLGYGVEPVKSGYVCDIFGHNSQLPQILNQFGIDNATLFRGRADSEKDNLLWTGADGSQVIVHKLSVDYAYSQFYFVARWPFVERGYGNYDELVSRVQKYLSEEEQNIALDCHLMIDGVDHADSCSEIPQLLQVLNERIPGYEFVHSNFEDYTASVRKSIDKLDQIEGCLYDIANVGANNSVIKNVLSSQVHLKQANDLAEYSTTLIAEPIDAFTILNREKMPNTKFYKALSPRQDLLNESWDLMLKNQPHDSICGCSLTATHLDNVDRFRNAQQIIDTVIDDELTQIATNIKTKDGFDGSFLVVNPSQVDQKKVKCDVWIRSDAVQCGFRIFNSELKELTYTLVNLRKRIEKKYPYGGLITFVNYDIYTIILNLELKKFFCETLYYTFNVMERKEGNFDWRLTTFNPPKRLIGTMKKSVNVVDNGKLIIEVNGNGALTITNKQTNIVYKDMMYFEDTADIGDGWNYYAPKFPGEYNSLGGYANISTEIDSPEVTIFKIEVALDLPTTSDYIAREKTVEKLLIRNYITIVKDSYKIEIKTEVKNNIVNHRLRVGFPTYIDSETFSTSIPYAMHSWSVKKKDNSQAREIDTFVNPNQGCVNISSLQESFTLYNKGLYEVSVLDREDRPVLLTLFRSFPNEVASFTSIMGKMLTDMSFEYAIDFERYESKSRMLAQANSFKVGILTKIVEKNSDGFLPNTFALYEYEGNLIVSSIRGYANGSSTELFLRLYDTDGGGSAKFTFNQKIKLVVKVDMRGYEKTQIAVNENSFTIQLNRCEIASLRVTFA